MNKCWPLFVGNVAESTNATLEVHDKFTGELMAKVALADAATIDRAIGLAHGARHAPNEQRLKERHLLLAWRRHSSTSVAEADDGLNLVLMTVRHTQISARSHSLVD